MKKGCLVFCAAALLALVLGGCGKTVQEAAVLEPEPEVIEATVVLAEETSPVEPEPEEIPEPEPLPEVRRRVRHYRQNILFNINII